MLGVGLGLNSSAGPVMADSRLLIPAASTILWMGDSISAQPDGRSLAAHMQFQARGLLNFHPNNYVPIGGSKIGGTIGVGGDKLEQTLANLVGGSRMQLANPGLGFAFHHCGTNNLTQDTAAVMIQRAKDNIAALWADGIPSVYSGILIRNDATGNNSANEQKRLDFNAGMAAAVGTTPGLLLFVDHDAVFNPKVDGTLVNPGDGLHPTFKGTEIIVANILSKLRLAATSLAALLPATNIVTNPTLSGTTGTLFGGTGATGPIPTGWTFENSTGATCVLSQGVEGGINYLDILLSGTATQTAQVRLSKNETGLGLATGQYNEGVFYAALSNGAIDGDAAGVGGFTATMTTCAIFGAGHPYASYGQMGKKFTRSPLRMLPEKDTGTGSLGFYMRVVPGVVDIRLRLYGDIWGNRIG